jgi:RNA-directed DNA polymerase
MQQTLFDYKEDNNEISLEDLFQAYFDCRKNKRNKIEPLSFELDFEKEVIKLWKEINKGLYKVSPLNVFISDKPVKREIFAAQFRDRIVHHLIINKLESVFEKEFIYDSYSCRKGRGTYFGIERIKRMIRRCSENYQKECWILKMDIKGYFMSINKDILFCKLKKLIEENYNESDKKKIIWLCKKIIENNPTKNCIRKSPREKWIGLPKSKSLFFASPHCGLPIGNYTNQVFANFYLNSFDHFIKSNLGLKHYGRYVDDFVIIDCDKEKLKKKIPVIRDFLYDNLKIILHPRKIYLQKSSKGVEFLGVLIRPWRSYVSSRIKCNFWELVGVVNQKLESKKLKEKEQKEILFQINSYLGVCSHCNTYSLRKKFLSELNWRFWGYFKTKNDLEKVVLTKKKLKKKKNRKSKKKRDEIKRKKSKKPKGIRRINAELDAQNKPTRHCEE